MAVDSTPSPRSQSAVAAEQLLVLFRRREDVYERARVYRSKGQLVPGSLGDDMIDLEADLDYALKRCREAGQP